MEDETKAETKEAEKIVEEAKGDKVEEALDAKKD